MLQEVAWCFGPNLDMQTIIWAYNQVGPRQLSPIALDLTLAIAEQMAEQIATWFYGTLCYGTCV